MKKLVIALVLIASAANAEEWLEMPNEAGGKILLLNGRCEGTTSGRMVIATTPQGTNVNGCWFYFADMIHIVWTGGRTSSFKPADFNYRKTND